MKQSHLIAGKATAFSVPQEQTVFVTVCAITFVL